MLKNIAAVVLFLFVAALFPPPAIGYSPPLAETSQSLTFNPTQDAYVRGDNANSNYGSSAALEVETDPDKNIFLRFEVSGVRGKVTSATLRLYPNSSLSAGFSLNIPTTSGTAGGGQWKGHWTESVVTYNLAPTIGPQITTTGAITSGTWIELDVKAFVAGNGYVIFAIDGLATQNLSLSSAEGANPPQLVVVYDEPPTHTYTPSQDSYVDSDLPTNNYATNVNLRTDGGNVPLDNIQYAFLRFNVTSLTASRDIETATLRIYAETGSDGAVEARATSGTWTEAGVTFNDAPGIGPVLDSVSSVSAASWVEFDVTKAVTGEGNVDFVLTSMLDSGATSVRWESEESSGSNEPELVVTMNFENVIVAAAGDLVCESTSSQTSGNCHSQDTVDAMVASNRFRGPDVFLALGDLQYEDGAIAEFNSEYNASYGEVLAITKPIIGNHDYGTDNDATGYFDYFGSGGSRTVEPGDPDPSEEGFYSEVLGDWRLYAFNSNCNKIAGGCDDPGAQNDWLDAQLAANSEECIIGIAHHLKYTSGQHSHDSLAAIDDIWTDLDGADADIMLAGHDHHYERTLKLDDSGNYASDGTREFVVGVGGRSTRAIRESGGEIDNPQTYTVVRDDKDFGFLELKLFDGWYEWNFYPNPDGISDDFVDSGSGWCNS